MGIHFTSGKTNLQEHKMCNRRRFGIAIHGQRYVQNITLGPDQKSKKMVIFANFISTHTELGDLLYLWFTVYRC